MAKKSTSGDTGAIIDTARVLMGEQNPSKLPPHFRLKSTSGTLALSSIPLVSSRVVKWKFLATRYKRAAAEELPFAVARVLTGEQNPSKLPPHFGQKKTSGDTGAIIDTARVLTGEQNPSKLPPHFVAKKSTSGDTGAIGGGRKKSCE